MIKVTKSNFKAEVVDSKKPVVIDFHADWCVPCQMMGPVLEAVSKELTDLKFVKVDVDLERGLAGEFLVGAIPLIVVVKNGVEIGRFTGLRQKEGLMAEIKEIIMKDEMA